MSVAGDMSPTVNEAARRLVEDHQITLVGACLCLWVGVDVRVYDALLTVSSCLKGAAWQAVRTALTSIHAAAMPLTLLVTFPLHAGGGCRQQLRVGLPHVSCKLSLGHLCCCLR